MEFLRDLQGFQNPGGLPGTPVFFCFYQHDILFLHRLMQQALEFLFKKMIYITQLIYLIEGKEEIFDQFEAIAIPIISRYNGRLLFRVRPNDNSFIGHPVDKPYEIHLVEFDTEKDFENFKQDEERKRFLNLKEQSIRTSILIQGKKL